MTEIIFGGKGQDLSGTSERLQNVCIDTNSHTI